jgi:hypothetical protein
VRPKLFQPFRLPVRLSIWLAWAVIILGVITVGSRSPEPNHPVGRLLLGLGLSGTGLVAVLALVSTAVWNRLIEPAADRPQARAQLYWVAGLGVVGLVLIGSALQRLL